ncbi:MAG: MFS transporter [Ignavibacteriae bacterium]|nr:MFS transporter [Ignavibacteriota bacterium]MCB9214719.1 MFS transporter [Ignavibacteria bacterium]
MKERSDPVLVIATLWLLVFAAASQIMIIAPILPRIAEELSVEKSALGLLMTIYAVSVGVFALIAGPISDRFGRRRILLVGAGLLAVTLGLHAFANTFAVLLLVRGLAGAAGGMLSGAAVSYVGDYFPVHQRGWASGWVMSGIAAGQILGVPLGNLLADWLGFRAPFLAFSIVAAVAFLFIWFRLPQPNVKLGESLSVRSALLGYGVLLRRSEVRAASGAFLAMFMGISLFVTFFPTWLEEYLGFSAFMVSMLYLVGGVANVIAGPRAGKLSDRIGRTTVIIGASVGVALLMPITTLVQPTFSWVIYPLFFLTMAFVASRMSPMQALMTQLATGAQRGTLMSLVTSIGQIGFGMGSAFASAVWRLFGFTGNAIVAMVSVLLMAGIVWQYLRKVELRMLEEELIEGEQMGEAGVPALTRHL